MSDRFESYENTLRNTLSESKTALSNKGVSVPETTKLRNVPALIDGIEVGHSGNAITINCKSDDFLGQTLTAKHTDGTTVTKTIDSLTCVIEIPKDGEWTVTNSVNSEQMKFTVDLTRDLYTFAATIVLSLINSSTNNWINDYSDNCVDLKTPSSVSKTKIYFNQFTNWKPGTKNTATYNYFPADAKGNWTGVLMRWGYQVISKSVDVSETGKTYNLSYYFTNSGTGWNDPVMPDQPTIGDELSEPQETVIQPKWYAVNTTDMTEQQQEEIFNEIDKMIKQNKSDEEINAYISSKEAEYGQI